MKRVELSPDALEEAAEEDAWWQENRPDTAELFEQELLAAIERIATQPWVGKHCPTPDSPKLQRVLLKKTRNHLYFVDQGEFILVVSIWGAVKKEGPPL